MSIITDLRRPSPRAYAPQDDYWYKRESEIARALSGVAVTPENALSISTVFRCVSAISQDIAGMPLIMYKRLPRGKERAENHPLSTVLGDQPNSWQTSFEWREMCMGHLLLRGNCYNLIQDGERGFADQLIPLNPARMKVEQLIDNSLKYTYSWANGRPKEYTQDEIWHLRGMSSDGIVGLSVIGLARESMGLGLAAEQYGARFFGQDASPGGLLTVKGKLGKEGRARLRESWNDSNLGGKGAHGTAVLEDGTTWSRVGLSNEDAQFLDTRNFQVEEMARWFGVPLHRIGHTEKATSWGTGIEQFTLGYINFTLMSWVRRWEQGITKDLILNPQRFFAEFLMDALLRGATRERFNAYRIAITTGWMNRNEAREKENMNAEPGLDDFLVPQNMATVGPDGQPRPLNQDQGGTNSFDNRARLMALETAGRLTRKELAAHSAAARRYEGDPEGYDVWALEFWDQHCHYVSDTLNISIEAARVYCGSSSEMDQEELELTIDNRTQELAQLGLGEIEYATAETTA